MTKNKRVKIIGILLTVLCLFGFILFYIKEHTDEEHKEQIAQLQKQYKETVAQAIECINKANRYHQIYQEDVLSKINNVKCKQSMNKAIVKLLKIK